MARPGNEGWPSSPGNESLATFSGSVPAIGLYIPAADTLGFAIASTGRVQLTATAFGPQANGGNALGAATLSWAHLFLATGGVINWNNGNLTMTHAAGAMTATGTWTFSAAGTALTVSNNAQIASLGVGVAPSGTAGRLTVNENLVVSGTASINGATGNTLVVNTTTLVVDATNSRVGIGTTSPAAVLHVATTSTTPPIRALGVVANPDVELARANGTVASPTTVLTGQTLGRISVLGHDGSSYLGAARIDFEAEGTIAATRVPSRIRFYTATDALPSVVTERMRIDSAGNVGIGTTGPSTLLHVGLAGTTLGTIGIAGNTSGLVTIRPAAAAGTWTFQVPADGGTNGQQLQTDGTGITSWAAAGSWREWKNILQTWDNPHNALARMIATPVHDFRYRPDGLVTTGDFESLYTGVLAEEAPWAMHHGGKVVNPVNTLGYMVLGFQAVNQRLVQLEAENAD